MGSNLITRFLYWIDKRPAKLPEDENAGSLEELHKGGSDDIEIVASCFGDGFAVEHQKRGRASS